MKPTKTFRHVLVGSLFLSVVWAERTQTVESQQNVHLQKYENSHNTYRDAHAPQRSRRQTNHYQGTEEQEADHLAQTGAATPTYYGPSDSLQTSQRQFDVGTLDSLQRHQDPINSGNSDTSQRPQRQNKTGNSKALQRPRGEFNNGASDILQTPQTPFTVDTYDSLQGPRGQINDDTSDNHQRPPRQTYYNQASGRSEEDILDQIITATAIDLGDSVGFGAQFSQGYIDLGSRDYVKEGAVTLAFVFDTTGSMFDDMQQVIDGAGKILNTVLEKFERPIHNYVFVPFHDPRECS